MWVSDNTIPFNSIDEAPFFLILQIIRLDIARVSEDHKDLPDDRILQTFQDTVDTRCFYERNSHVEHPGGEGHV